MGEIVLRELFEKITLMWVQCCHEFPPLHLRLPWKKWFAIDSAIDDTAMLDKSNVFFA
jgi:hypothetical protein